MLKHIYLPPTRFCERIYFVVRLEKNQVKKYQKKKKSFVKMSIFSLFFLVIHITQYRVGKRGFKGFSSIELMLPPTQRRHREAVKKIYIHSGSRNKKFDFFF